MEKLSVNLPNTLTLKETFCQLSNIKFIKLIHERNSLVFRIKFLEKQLFLTKEQSIRLQELKKLKEDLKIQLMTY